MDSPSEGMFPPGACGNDILFLFLSPPNASIGGPAALRDQTKNTTQRVVPHAMILIKGTQRQPVGFHFTQSDLLGFAGINPGLHDYESCFLKATQKTDANKSVMNI